ncbi:hypothetical protein [Defluviitalea saccharophila]|uniref:Uncharacterized protein n=1 Tax=Defluviitalea saccharophila TaxID=879970 RepID=A0ABZ2Y1W6_9FIRM|nr:hypothetical protein [Candidatus Epulonipiscium sp.]
MDYFSNDRVVLIENKRGGWYEKAIFILNKDVNPKQMPKDIVEEAEKIIGDYIKRNKPIHSRKKLKKRRIDWILNCCLILSIVLFMYYAAQVF